MHMDVVRTGGRREVLQRLCMSRCHTVRANLASTLLRRAALTLLDGRPVRSLSAHARSRTAAAAGVDARTSALTPPPLQPGGDSLAPQISPTVMSVLRGMTRLSS